MHTPLFGAVEAGGTKFLCSVGASPTELQEPVRIPTTTPEETLQAVVAYFSAAQEKHGKLAAIGVGTFGPAGVSPGAADFGFITTTPKPGWQQTDILGTLRKHFPVAYGFDTDVNAAVLGETEEGGAAVGAASPLYITVGTGIGGGAMVGGKLVHGLLHPEMGHIRLPKAPGDAFAGCCPWHGDCFEGLASGTALAARWGQPAESLPPEHPAWAMQAHYLGTAVANFLLTISCDRIVLGGSVCQAPGLLEKTREVTRQALAGYLSHPLANAEIARLIVPPQQKQPPGLVGALRLAMQAWGDSV